MKPIDSIINELAPLRQTLIKHPLYNNINSINSIKIFMQMHIFAVWDFMSLLKSLQNTLTCTTTPWIPTEEKLSRRFINEIVLCEESDYNENNETMSHFEMYLQAMEQINANTSLIQQFIATIQEKKDIDYALHTVDIEDAIKEFVGFTFEIINSKKPHLIAAVFTFSRENLIPDMFIEFVKELNKKPDENCNKLLYYLERHIEVDGDEHGPMSLNLISQLCDSEEKWEEAKAVSKEALKKRISLWDSIHQAILQNNTMINQINNEHLQASL